jgi:hypothetical protein
MENKTMKQILNRASVVLAFVLMFFSLSAFADIFDDGFEAGKKFCRNNPKTCGINFTDKDASKQEGIKSCTDNPESCGLEHKDGSKQDGIKSCKDNPESCGLEHQDGSRQDGITFCQQNPSACGIVLNDTNGSRQEGIDFCKGNPSACEIAVNNNPTLQTEAKSFCQKNLEKCGVTEEALNVLKNEGKLECTDKPETCFTQINENPKDEKVPEDFCEKKTKNCYSKQYGLYLNAVNAAEPVDELGNVSTLLTDITMDVFYNGKDTALFMIKIKDLESKIDEEKKRKDEVAKKAQDETKTSERSSQFSQNITKAITTVEEQKQPISSNNTIKTAKTIDYYPATVIYSSEEDKPIQLNISKIGAGEVISYPNGIACGEDCQEHYPRNYPVELFAVPIDSNVSLKEWRGDCEAKKNHITVIMDANKTCIAVFE